MAALSRRGKRGRLLEWLPRTSAKPASLTVLFSSRADQAWRWVSSHATDCWRRVRCLSTRSSRRRRESHTESLMYSPQRNGGVGHMLEYIHQQDEVEGTEVSTLLQWEAPCVETLIPARRGPGLGDIQSYDIRETQIAQDSEEEPIATAGVEHPQIQWQIADEVNEGGRHHSVMEPKPAEARRRARLSVGFPVLLDERGWDGLPARPCASISVRHPALHSAWSLPAA